VTHDPLCLKNERKMDRKWADSGTSVHETPKNIDF